jgi:Kdo2-lipid IVA lauroyltransferase/acyltransferase
VAEPRNKYKDYLVYLGVRWMSMVMHCWPVGAMLAVAGFAGTCYYYLVPRHRKRAVDNLRPSYPNASEKTLRAIAHESIRQMFQFGVEFIYTPRLIRVDNFNQFVHLNQFRESLDLMLRKHKGLILLTGHYGNWEILGYTLATLGFPLTAVARPLDNPYLNRHVFGVREQRGAKIIAKKGATEEITAVLDNRGMVGFTADQDAGKKGLFVDFFHRKASSYKSIGLVAMQYDVPIIIGYARRVRGKFQFECAAQDIIYPDDWKSQDQPLHYITQRYTKAIEDMVRVDPTQYLWAHRRWKTRPKDEAAAG